VPREPDAVVLIMDFVAVAHIALLHRTVTAQIEDRRQRRIDRCRQVEIAGNVKSRSRLELDPLDDEVVLFDSPFHASLKIGAKR